jgi:peptidoglycan/xylan/chitin deacetylase (PgdA/CDA1 family)
MGIDDLRFLIKNGWEIGGHGWNHYDLSKLPIHEVEKEIKMCKEWIKKELNYEANKFAYPYGIYDMSIIQIVKKYFKFAYTIDNSFFQISRRIRKDVWR